jgi:hypothetical protein
MSKRLVMRMKRKFIVIPPVDLQIAAAHGTHNRFAQELPFINLQHSIHFTAVN